MIILQILLCLLCLIVLLGFTNVTADAEYDDLSGKNLTVRIRWLFITLYPRPVKRKRKAAKPARTKKRKRKATKAAKADAERITPEDIYKDEADKAVTETDDLFFKNDHNNAPPESEAGEPASGDPEADKTKAGKPKKKGGLSEKLGLGGVDLKMVKELLKSAKRPIRYLFSRIYITRVMIHLIVGGDDAARAALSYGAQSTLVHNLCAFLDKFCRLYVDDITVDVDFEHKRNDLAFRFRIRLNLWTMVICVLWFVRNIYAGKSAKHADKTEKTAKSGKTGKAKRAA